MRPLLALILMLLPAAPAHAIIRADRREAERLVRPRKRVNATVAHRHHVHGAARRTSFWSAGR